VKVSVCAVCRTDIHIVEGDLALHKMPLIPGHQIVGRVDEIGDGVTRLWVGQRIGIAWLRHVDGTCQFCRRGRENLCRDSRYTGYDADGGYAEYAVVPEDFAYELPEGIDDEHVSPLLCGGLIGYRALRMCGDAGEGSSAAGRLRRAPTPRLPGKADGAVLFAPSGKRVPPTLRHSIARGLFHRRHSFSVMPARLRRHLYQERELRSVTANTREDVHALLAEAAEAHVQPRTTAYALADANRALRDMKHSNIEGTPVLVIAAGES
jgi:propanol-preferring alcohol dehydrogenase